MLPISEDLQITSIVEQNKDVESLVVQSAMGRSVFFKDKFKPLQFIHFTDIHAKPELWQRINEYMDHYSDTIQFALHTGDFCSSDQTVYCDLYNSCTPSCRPIYNCTGNHDTYPCWPWDGKPSTKERVHQLLFNRTENWNAVFMSGENSMTYYMDYPDANLRFIVLDNYYSLEEQKFWLKSVLEDAKQKGYHTVTASHQKTDYLTVGVDVTFNSPMMDDASDCDITVFDEIIADFKAGGGVHVCHLAGHDHKDRFGYTKNEVLNVVLECATDWYHHCDGIRVRGTKTYDSFNVVTIDTVSSHLKLVRVGNNCDRFLRSKRALCYDYINKKIIYND